MTDKPRSNYPIHDCWEYRPKEDRYEPTPCACRYPGDHPWPPHGGEQGRRLIATVTPEPPKV